MNKDKNIPVGFSLEQGDLNRPSTGRPVIYANNGIISSGHYLTSMAGMKMLLSGGNAFDALVSSTIAAAVIEPIASYSLGAEAVYMLYDAKNDEIISLCGQGTLSLQATPSFFQNKGLENIPTGPGQNAPLSFTVPGVVKSSLSLLMQYGTKSVEEVFAPAIEYADKGIPNYEYMIERLNSGDSVKQFELFPPGGKEIFFDNDELPKPGTLLVQKALGKVLKMMVDAENNAIGHRNERILAASKCFYEDELADLISHESKSVGGILQKEDLESYSEKYETPIDISFMGHKVHSHSTWTQGPVLLQALNILENFDLKSMGHNSSQYIHTIVEALKLALADREAFYGDPDFSTIPIDGLISKEYAKERSKMISMDKASPGLPDYGNPWAFSKSDGKVSAQPFYDKSLESDNQHEAGTTHISIIDRHGNMACSTPSGGAFNKSVFFSELGFALSTRSEMTNLVDGHPNVAAPGKRPRTSIINYIISKDDVPIMTVGCPGGDAQTQGNLQMILNTLLWDMNPQEASEAPRFSSDSAPNSFYPHTYLPGNLSMEDGFAEEVKSELTKLGHKITYAATCGMGATVVKRDPSSGVLSAGADPRRACYAIGY